MRHRGFTHIRCGPRRHIIGGIHRPPNFSQRAYSRLAVGAARPCGIRSRGVACVTDCRTLARGRFSSARSYGDLLRDRNRTHHRAASGIAAKRRLVGRVVTRELLGCRTRPTRYRPLGDRRTHQAGRRDLLDRPRVAHASLATRIRDDRSCRRCVATARCESFGRRDPTAES